ncbi:MAG: penicillin-binding protein [Deltaproteobacteria bacterium]|nr:MAG: penicillin-binding protein [Deltaproteobacteria bacterium]
MKYTFDSPAFKRRGRRRPKRGLYLLASALIGLALLIYTLAPDSATSNIATPEDELRLPEIHVTELFKGLSCPSPTYDEELGKYIETIDKKRVVYTLDRELQEAAESVLARYSVPYGAFVAIEPETGKVLAMAEYSSREEVKGFTLKADYPAASLVKIVTGAAALKTGEVTPDTIFRYEGNPYKLWKRKLNPKNKRRENNKDTFAGALGRSNNVVFGKVGVNTVGPERLRDALGEFGFNQGLDFDFPLASSTAEVPDDEYQLARTSAGFGDVKISPLHAALIAAAVSNGGVMMRPWIVESVEDPVAGVIYSGAPQPMLRVAQKKTASQLAAMMRKTITTGTSTKIFYKYAKKLVRKIAISGKTGSLRGDSPPGNYEWFIGFAPEEGSKIAVAGLVVNQGDLWHIKGTYAAMTVMRKFFGL